MARLVAPLSFYGVVKTAQTHRECVTERFTVARKYVMLQWRVYFQR